MNRFNNILDIPVIDQSEQSTKPWFDNSDGGSLRLDKSNFERLVEQLPDDLRIIEFRTRPLDCGGILLEIGILSESEPYEHIAWPTDALPVKTDGG
jgi:hypothetical protein